MTEDYELLISKLDEYESKLTSLEERLASITEFNKALLNKRVEEPKEPKDNDLEKKLKGGLRL